MLRRSFRSIATTLGENLRWRANAPLERYDISISMNKEHYVYIITNKSRTLYTGVTNNLMRRVSENSRNLWQNKEKQKSMAKNHD